MNPCASDRLTLRPYSLVVPHERGAFHLQSNSVPHVSHLQGAQALSRIPSLHIVSLKDARPEKQSPNKGYENKEEYDRAYGDEDLDDHNRPPCRGNASECVTEYRLYYMV